MTARPAGKAARQTSAGTGISMLLPRVSPNMLAGLDGGGGGRALQAAMLTCRSWPATLQMEIDDLFPVAEVLQLLRFAELAEGDIRLTEPGRRFVGLEPDARKKLFAQHLLAYVPLAGHIRRVLDERGTHRAPGQPLPRRARGPHVRAASPSRRCGRPRRGAASARSSPMTR